MQPENCASCAHHMDTCHVIVLVRRTPRPMGLVLCETPGCGCSATWSAQPGRSAQAQVLETRKLVREQLLRDGLPLPACLV